MTVTAVRHRRSDAGDGWRWRAVLGRDSSFDGRFVYAVRTTGVYCRPSCPARKPASLGRVEFFDSAEEAERQGYRACLRCRPGDAGGAGAVGDDARRVEAVCRYVQASLDGRLDGGLSGSLTLAALGGVAGVSPYHLQRTFKRVLGVTPGQYVRALRFGRLRAELRGGMRAAGAIYGAGFGSGSRVYERAAEEMGMTPADYGRGGRGQRIGFVTARCGLGWLLVAATGRGVCAVRLGDGEAELAAALRAEYPAAEVREGDGRLAAWCAAVLSELDGEGTAAGLPLDVRATAFQRRVWAALRAIPRGQTRTYTQVAETIGRPDAVRAVAGACAANPVALVVPCHRALRRDGKLGGYRWGLERKRELLAAEGKGVAGG